MHVGILIVKRELLTARYFFAHVVTAWVCVGVVFGVPLIALFALVTKLDDPGGPMFLPVVVFMLVSAAFQTAVSLSATTAMADFARYYRSIPLWLPPLVVFYWGLLLPPSLDDGLCGVAFKMAEGLGHPLHLGGVIWAMLFGFCASPGFSLYWFGVYSAERMFAPKVPTPPPLSRSKQGAGVGEKLSSGGETPPGPSAAPP